MAKAPKAYFVAEDSARKYLEKLRWPDGAVCPHCGATEPCRLPPRLYQCNGCRRQFSVTAGTIFQDSNAPLHKWLLAIDLMCGPGKGMTAIRLHDEAGFGSYWTAWRMCHRLRWALQKEPVAALLKRAGEEAPLSSRRPLRIRLPWDLAVRGLLAVALDTRDSIKGERKTGAKLERRPAPPR